jgi:hypothetical protein
MSFLTRVMLEAEDASAIDLIQRNGGLQRVLREEGLRAAMQAAARQSNLRVNSSGRLDRSANRPNGPGEAGPVRTGSGVVSPARGGSSIQVGGDLITNNTPGRPSVSMIGRSRPAKPVQSAEPDQIWSAPPGPRRRSSPLETPGS